MRGELNFDKRGLHRWFTGFIALGLLISLVVSLGSSVVHAAPVFKQVKFNQKTGFSTSVAAAFSSANTAGGLIVVSVEWNSSATPSITDSRGNTYLSAGAVLTSPNSPYKEQTFYAMNVASGSNTVTAQFNGTPLGTFSDLLIYAHEYSGIATSNALSATSTQTGITSAMSSGSLTTTNANSLLYAVATSNSQVTSATAGYTTRSTNGGNLTEDINVASAGTYAATATQSSNGWTFRVIAFKSVAQPPVAPTSAPDMTSGTDTGLSNTDNITNDATPTFTGNCTNGETVTLLVNGSAVSPTAVCSGNAYSITPNSNISSNNVTTTFTNSSGTSSQSPVLAVTIDTSAPAAPVILSPADNSTQETTTPVISGTGEQNARVGLIIDSAASINITANSSGNWSHTPVSGLSQNIHTLTATQTDVAGNISANSPARTFTIATRNPLKQPFASNSIWNMPIGSSAQYVNAGLQEITSSYGGDGEWTPIHYPDPDLIVMRPTAPLTNIYLNEEGWSGGNRCVAQGGVIHTVPIPTDFVVANSLNNNSASFLMPDGRTIVQTQPFTRCAAGGVATSWTTYHPEVDIYGPGIEGAHGGSGLSAVGGTLRVGELRPSDTTGPKHALKINLISEKELYKCLVDEDCHRWPAPTSDGGSVGWYGTETNNQNTAMKMGALLAIPASVNLNSLGLETQQAKLLAWTLQNYGAYIVDHGGPSFSVEEGPDGSFTQQFQSDWGTTMEVRVRDNNAWGRDFNRLRQALHVVDNNSPTTIGGGGVPRQPLAPEIHP